jgi:hypothetical protein
VELFAGHTISHYDCSIIADLLKHRMTGISYLWLLLNVMIAILVCKDQQCHKIMPSAPYAGRCLLRSSGGGRAAVVVAAQRHSMPHFSACCAGLQPSEHKKNARAGLILGERASRPGWDGEAERSY